MERILVDSEDAYRRMKGFAAGFLPEIEPLLKVVSAKSPAEATVDIKRDEPASVCSVTASLEYAASDSQARARSFTKSNSTPRQL